MVSPFFGGAISDAGSSAWLIDDAEPRKLVGLVFRIFGLLGNRISSFWGFVSFSLYFFELRHWKHYKNRGFREHASEDILLLDAVFLDCTNSSLIDVELRPFICLENCAILTLIGFWGENGVFQLASLRGFCGNKARNTKNIGTRLRWVFSKVDNHEKKRGFLWESFLLIWTKLPVIRTVYLATLPVFCGNEARNGFSRGGGWDPNCFERSHQSPRCRKITGRDLR